ncbi:MAG: signal peptidase II [Erysipelotrichaceae bacterium]|nr:signal peptidase II [Erysipelotrichaceae bacterium]
MHYLIYFFIVAVLVFIDQFSKSLIVSTIDLNQSITVIKGFFNITYVRNFGAGFSIMQNATTTFYIITPICLILFIYLLIKTKEKDYLSKTALLLMIGGTIGNFLDRIINVYVVDFLDFIIFGWDFPVFNFADICLTIGVGIYIVSLLKESKNERA